MNEPQMSKALLNTKEACDYLGINRDILARYRRAGLIPYIRIGRNYMHPITALNQFITDNVRKEITIDGVIVGDN